MKELIESVIDWADAKGIYEHSTALSQRLYAIGELTNEFRDAIAKNKSSEEIKTELGDVLVFYINYMAMSDKSAEHIVNRFSNASFRAWCPEDNVDLGISAAVDDSKLTEVFLAQIAAIALGMDSTLEECLQLAYDKISKRTGKMQNGKLVKESEE
jgi:NTP pyrophosphatase (non-canonical NTP hydrolase)